MIGGARGAGFFGCCLLFDVGSSGIVCAGTRRCEAMRRSSAALVAPDSLAAACSSTLAAAASFGQARSGARRCDDWRRSWRRILWLLPALRRRQQRHRLPKHVSVRGDAMTGGARGAGFFGCCLLSTLAAAASFAQARVGARRYDDRRRSWRRLLWLLPGLRLWQQRHRLRRHATVRGDAMAGDARGARLLFGCLLFDVGSSGIACPKTFRCEAMR